MSTRAKLFWNGRSQAVRLPKEFRFSGDEVLIRRAKDKVILEPVHKGWDDYGRVRAHLERRGRPIGAMDTLIAAHALSLGATLVSNNVREFKRLLRLWCENWVS